MDLTSNATNIRASVHIELKLGLCIWSQNWVLSDYVSNDFDYTSLLNCYKWGPPGKKCLRAHTVLSNLDLRPSLATR